MPLSDKELEAIACVLADRMDTRRRTIMPRLMDVEGSARYLGQPVGAVRLIIQRGTLPLTQLDGKNQVDRLILDEILRGRIPTVATREPFTSAQAAIRRRPSERRFVYFVASGENAVKIGVTDDVLSRMKELQTKSPLPLKLLLVMPGDRETKYELHQAFWALRISGGWFRFEGPLKRLVEGSE
jgi:hypothetical protein